MSDIVERLAKRCSHTEKTCPECAGDRRDALAEIERLREALARIADKDAWAAKYPFGNYECIAVESIGIARDALRATDQPAAAVCVCGDPACVPKMPPDQQSVPNLGTSIPNSETRAAMEESRRMNDPVCSCGHVMYQPPPVCNYCDNDE
jgi:hypothetical protein